jgi:uncharacterized protein
MKSSIYNYIQKIDENRYVLFNKFHGSIAIVGPDVAGPLQKGEIHNISNESIDECLASGFIVEAIQDEIEEGKKRFQESLITNGTLNITLEISQKCNFGCLYCYQNSYRKETGIISLDIIKKTLDYVIEVTKRKQVSKIKLCFIGGEPLLNQKEIWFIVSSFSDFAKKNGVILEKKLDTNGYLLNDAIVREMDFISVSLTNKEDHDKFRTLRNGLGTYEQIINNLEELSPVFNNYNTFLSVRFNANNENISYLKEMFLLIESIGIKKFEISLFNTINYDYNNIKNQLSNQEFGKYYIDFLRFLFESDKTINDFPLPTFSVCKAYHPFNLKVSWEGKLALCDAFYPPIGHIDDLKQNPERYFEIFKDYVGHNPYSDSQCRNCPDIGICGGKYFCKETDLCNFLPYCLEDYLDFFVECYPQKPHLFQFL